MRNVLAAVLIATSISGAAVAQESSPPNCTNGTDVRDCSEGNSVSVGVTPTGKELDNLAKYPIEGCYDCEGFGGGQRTVPRIIISNFFRHLF